MSQMSSAGNWPEGASESPADAYDREWRELEAQRDELRRMVEQALFLAQNGERPPGAPRGDLGRETWPRWSRRAEAFLRETRGGPQ